MAEGNLAGRQGQLGPVPTIKQVSGREGRKLRIEGTPETAMLAAMRVPLLDLSEQYRTLAGPIAGEDRPRSSPASISSSARKVEEFERAICDFTAARRMPSVFPPARTRFWPSSWRWTSGPGDAVITTRLQFFRHRRLHRAGWRDAALRRHRSGDLQHFAGGTCRIISRRMCRAAREARCVMRTGQRCAPSCRCISSGCAARWSDPSKSPSTSASL